MTATTPLALAPAPIPPRPRVLFVGTAFAAAAAAMGLLALVGVYVAQRAEVLAGNQTWLPEGSVIPLTAAQHGGAHADHVGGHRAVGRLLPSATTTASTPTSPWA